MRIVTAIVLSLVICIPSPTLAAKAEDKNKQTLIKKISQQISSIKKLLTKEQHKKSSLMLGLQETELAIANSATKLINIKKTFSKKN